MTQPKVKVFSTRTCPYCVMEKSWLEEKKVDHTVVYVEENMDEAMQMVQKTGQMGVPVTQITDKDGKEEFIIGFDREKLIKSIGL